MLNNNLNKQNGFTIIELLIAFAIAAIFLTGLVRFSQTAYSVKDDIMNQANAVNQVKNAFNYISQDTLMAGMVVPTDPSNVNSNHFPLTLRWIKYPTDEIYVIYSIDANGTFQRNYSDSEDPTQNNTMNIAKFVNSDAAKTNCIWDNVQNSLIINLTISKGSVNLSRKFVITPRVIKIPNSKIAASINGNSAPNPSSFGQSVNLNATVLPSVASGMVTFFDGGNSIGISPIINGAATYPVLNLSVGGHSIKAVYSGDANYLAITSNTWTQTVNKANSTVALTSSLNPSAPGYSVTFTATVVPNNATGTITFKDGGTALPGNSTVTISSGTATFEISTLVLGSHFITAIYSGDSNYTTSTGTLTQVVNNH